MTSTCCRAACTKLSYTLMLGLLLLLIIFFGVDFYASSLLVSPANFNNDHGLPWF